MTHQETMNALETIVDRTSLDRVLAALVDICDEKATHIATNWQDRPLANTWRKDAALLARVTVKLNN